jgi:peptide deformylase
MKEIVHFGYPSLKIDSTDVLEFDKNLKNLTDEMIQIMYNAPGVGLAAPQIGINKNIFVFDAGDGPKVAINPHNLILEGSITFMEGCLSLPGYYWDIERAEYASLDCFDLAGNQINFEGDDLTGRVLQHEYDHLNGKVLLTALKRKERKAALKNISLNGFPGNDV